MNSSILNARLKIRIWDFKWRTIFEEIQFLNTWLLRILESPLETTLVAAFLENCATIMYLLILFFFCHIQMSPIISTLPFYVSSVLMCLNSQAPKKKKRMRIDTRRIVWDLICRTKHFEWFFFFFPCTLRLFLFESSIVLTSQIWEKRSYGSWICRYKTNFPCILCLPEHEISYLLMGSLWVCGSYCSSWILRLGKNS